MNKQVRSRERCKRKQVGDGIKFFTMKAHPKRAGIYVEYGSGISAGNFKTQMGNGPRAKEDWPSGKLGEQTCWAR